MSKKKLTKKPKKLMKKEKLFLCYEFKMSCSSFGVFQRILKQLLLTLSPPTSLSMKKTERLSKERHTAYGIH